MAHLDKSVATLRIAGDALDPAEVTRLLGCEPTDSYRKGDVKKSKHQDIVRRTGLWRLEASDRQPEDLDAQIAELLGRLSPDLDAWASLAHRFELDLFCGFFMKQGDEGLEVSAASLKALGERGIKLAMCLYAPSLEDRDVAA